MKHSVSDADPSAVRSRNMASVRRVNTVPEVRLRSALHRAGYRFRKDHPVRVNGKLIRPDIAFTAVKLAIFVDGCFWHRCPEHMTSPKTNVEFWRSKLDGNAERDQRQNALLASAGWSVLRFWEHEDPQSAARTIATAVDEARRVRPM